MSKLKTKKIELKVLNPQERHKDPFFKKHVRKMLDCDRYMLVTSKNGVASSYYFNCYTSDVVFLSEYSKREAFRQMDGD